MKNQLHTSITGLLILLLASFSCEISCNDCLELETKEIYILDESGNNLIFGEDAIYEFGDINIHTPNGEMVHFFANDDLGSITIMLPGDEEAYSIELNENEVDQLAFTFKKKDSKTCCGSTYVTTSIKVNGAEVDNADSITIIK